MKILPTSKEETAADPMKQGKTSMKWSSLSLIFALMPPPVLPMDSDTRCLDSWLKEPSGGLSGAFGADRQEERSQGAEGVESAIAGGVVWYSFA